MLGTYLIGLREGLEATLVVTILIAYLVKTRNTQSLLSVWGGVGAAVLVSLGFAQLLQIISTGLQFRTQEIFEGVASIIAVALVTWMVFWMRKAARYIRAELEGKLEDALVIGPLAVATVAFVAVTREGLETVLFIRQNIQAAASTTGPLIGALLGIVTAIVLGYLLYQGALRLNFKRFFTWTGAFLILVAAGVLRYGVHDLQEADVLPGGAATAFDVSWLIDPASWYGALLAGTFNIVPNPTWLEVIAWSAYVLPVMYLFLRPAAAPQPAQRGQRKQPVDTPR